MILKLTPHFIIYFVIALLSQSLSFAETSTTHEPNITMQSTEYMVVKSLGISLNVHNCIDTHKKKNEKQPSSDCCHDEHCTNHTIATVENVEYKVLAPVTLYSQILFTPHALIPKKLLFNLNKPPISIL